MFCLHNEIIREQFVDKIRQLMDKLDQVELWLTFFFLLDYILYLYAAEQRLKHVMTPLRIIDFITILPSLLIFFIETEHKSRSSTGEEFENKELETATQLNFLRFVRVLKLLRVLRLLRTVKQQSPSFAVDVDISRFRIRICEEGAGGISI